MLQDSTAVVGAVADAFADVRLTTLVLAAGALGTAAFGIVEASKWLRFVGEAGFGAALRILDTLTTPLQVAYGSTYEKLLRGQYRGDQQDLKRLLRQGVRVGLTPANAPAVAEFLGAINGAALAEAVRVASTNGPLDDAQRALIGRYELAADARIDAALTVAQADYIGAVRIYASFVAIVIALIVAVKLGESKTIALLVGVAAVPLAPIAKDVAAGIQAASKALKAKA